MISAVEPLVPISALEHHLYCPRQCALIHVEGLWFDNEHTARGNVGHQRADHGGDRTERAKRVLRAVPLWSEVLGLSGRADAIEISAGGIPAPVEYKIGTRHGGAAHVQLCAEALCLEEMTGLAVPEGFIWLAGPRRRLRVTIDEVLRNATTTAIAEVRTWLEAGTLPAPVNDRRCGQCQLLEFCLPELVARPEAVRRYVREVLGCAS